MACQPVILLPHMRFRLLQGQINLIRKEIEFLEIAIGCLDIFED
jgi:hypothetical protein